MRFIFEIDNNGPDPTKIFFENQMDLGLFA